MKRSNVSAGLLMFRVNRGNLEIFLVHPGGPFWGNKDDGAWTIPKGEISAPDEDLLTRARREFEEELGFAPPATKWVELGQIKQKGGKTVHGWAFEGDLPREFKLKSNTFEIEWPPRSGKKQTFPEIDCADFFGVEIAKTKINPAQIAFIERLIEQLKQTPNKPMI